MRVIEAIDECLGTSWVPDGRYVDLPVRGRTYVHDLAGPEAGPVVVLLHGWTATAALNWGPSFGPLAGRFRVVALDHRGHGRGLRSSSPFRLEDCADDVAALLGELGVTRCIAVGYSMGGPIAQLLCRRHPHLVEGMVLCATSATFHGTAREWLLTSLAAGSSVVAGAPPVRAAFSATSGALAWLRAPGHRRASTGHDWTRIVEAGREICRFDSRSWIDQLSVPTAVVATMADEVVPSARQLDLARSIPGASLRVVSGGHSVCTTAPVRFVPALVGACTEVAERARLGEAARAA
jgi:3-oxoadipate enol-lactonase